MKHILVENPCTMVRISNPGEVFVGHGYIYYDDGFRVYVRISACFGSGSYRIRVKLPKHKALHIRYDYVPRYSFENEFLMFYVELCSIDKLACKLQTLFDYIWFTD